MACFVYQLVSELRLYAVKNSTVYQLLYYFSFEKQAESLVENVCNKDVYYYISYTLLAHIKWFNLSHKARDLSH